MPVISQRRARFGAAQVLDRHVDDRRRDQRLDQRRKPLARGDEAEGGGEQRDRVGHRERGDDLEEIPAESAERDHDTQQEEEMIESAENVADAGLHEGHCRALPAPVERHRAGRAGQQVDPFPAARRQESHIDDELVAERADRVIHENEVAAVRRDRVLEVHVEVAPVPEDAERRRQRRLVDERKRLRIDLERTVRWRGDALGRPNVGKPIAVLADLELLGRGRGRSLEGLVDAPQIEVSRLAPGQVQIHQELERDAHEQVKAVRLRFHEGVHRDRIGNLVRGRRRGPTRPDEHTDKDAGE